ncbi:MAG: polysaccharide deacetylase family protein, partial [Planctomycetota bacterium]
MKKTAFLLLIFLIIFFPSILFAQTVSLEICDWQGGASGAASVSIDDSFTSCRDILNEYGFKGTYFLHYTDKFSEADWDIWRSVYEEGHEIGGHTLTSPCVILDEETTRAELSANKSDIIENLNIPEEEIISFAWPCGVNNVEMGITASEFYISARGYHINELEDKNPKDFMNLKSINTPHYHEPNLDPPDYFQKADEAEELGLWVNYVFHNHCVDDGAIAYLTTKDLWVATIGRVIKYIKQRQNTTVTNFIQTGSEIRFELQNSLDPYMF